MPPWADGVAVVDQKVIIGDGSLAVWGIPVGGSGEFSITTLHPSRSRLVAAELIGSWASSQLSARRWCRSSGRGEACVADGGLQMLME